MFQSLRVIIKQECVIECQSRTFKILVFMSKLSYLQIAFMHLYYCFKIQIIEL